MTNSLGRWCPFQKFRKNSNIFANLIWYSRFGDRVQFLIGLENIHLITSLLLEGSGLAEYFHLVTIVPTVVLRSPSLVRVLVTAFVKIIQRILESLRKLESWLGIPISQIFIAGPIRGRLSKLLLLWDPDLTYRGNLQMVLWVPGSLWPTHLIQIFLDTLRDIRGLVKTGALVFPQIFSWIYLVIPKINFLSTSEISHGVLRKCRGHLLLRVQGLWELLALILESEKELVFDYLLLSDWVRYIVSSMTSRFLLFDLCVILRKIYFHIFILLYFFVSDWVKKFIVESIRYG